jgi:hypothetical protein
MTYENAEEAAAADEDEESSTLALILGGPQPLSGWCSTPPRLRRPYNG